MKIDDNLNDIFDIEPDDDPELSQTFDIIDVDGEVVPVNSVPDAQQIKDDTDKVRENLYKMIVQGKDALESVLQLAKDSENPKAYDAFSKILEKVTILNAELLETHSRKQKLTGITKTDDTSKTVTNNSIFVGTTSELKKMLEELKK